MENISNIQTVNADTLEFQDYQQSDEALISSFEIKDISFDSSLNLIEYHVLDSNKNLIASEYNFKDYSLLDNNVSIDPKSDLTQYGLNEGQYYTLYHFLTPLLNSSETNTYYISDISSDRTEIRISSNNIDGLAIKEGYNTFISSSTTTDYFTDFYLNFGNNDLVISNNILLDESDPTHISILIKLYEPLPLQFDIKTELWVIEKLSDSIAYFIELITVFNNQDNIISLKGPNLNIDVKDKINNSTSYINYTTLQSSVSSSLTNQLNNILLNKSIRLNIDYTDYANFVHFSSANTRLENFYYKLSLIETYKIQYLSSSLSLNNYYISSSQNVWLNKIQEIEQGLDGYEYYLYYTSGSSSWPKSNSTTPYLNYPTTSSQGSNWLISQSLTASQYDSLNKDALINSIPLYLSEDPDNNNYQLFVEMLGQHFDTLYVYYGEITNKYDSDNRINSGMSKDLISDVLKDFGVKIYQNNFSTNDLYSSFLGITSNLNLLPPTGSELITNYITASNAVIPLEDNNAELYKRIYHNLPLLYKKKGTVEGLRLLINLYGIPDTVLRINEFGGKNKNNTNDWDQFQNQFNYAFTTTSSGWIQAPFDSGVYGGTPQAIEFRFKPFALPITSSYQILSTTDAISSPIFIITLDYTGSSYSSGSYSSSISDPYNAYGTLKVVELSSLKSSSIYLPFFNGDWWSVLLNCDKNNLNFTTLYSANNIYSGYDGNKIGFKASSSFTPDGFWYSYPIATSMSLSSPVVTSVNGTNYRAFSGSFQELRYYSLPLSESVFLDYVMNPYSIEGNIPKTGNEYFLNNLMFRAPLGSVLDISGSSRTSIHPSQTLYPVTQSTNAGSGYKLSGSFSFIPNTEIIYFDQFPSGIKNVISNKIRIEDNILPSGSVISPYISIQQDFPISQSYTRDVNYVEVSFSPQNEINDDIISQLGYFNIGDYIGDPRQLTNSTASFYPDFNKIRNSYFSKYQRNYNLNDFIRLIKYFDNSLFKLIKDFVPARTSLASGIIIKQHLLERNRYSPAQVSHAPQDYSASVLSNPFAYTGSHPIYKFTGGQGGVMPELSSSFTYPWFKQVTQSWSEPFDGPLGHSQISHSSQDEFYNGIFKGAKIVASTQSLQNNPYLHNKYQSLNYNLVFWNNVYGSDTHYSSSLYPNTGINNKDFETSFLAAEPLVGQMFIYTNPNVNYIKINNIDVNSVNNKYLLNNIQEIDVLYTNNTVGKYKTTLIGKPISSSLYSVIQNPNYYSSDGFTTGSYNLSGSDSSSFVGNSSNDLYILNINSNISDPNKYLISGSGGYSYYRINTGSAVNYINTLIDYRLSFNISNINTSFYLQLQKVNPPSLLTPIVYLRYPPSSSNPNGQPTILTGSFVADKDASYRILLFTLSTDPGSYYPYTINNISASFTQRALPQSGSLPKLINIPSYQEIIDFPLSNYDVTHGNLDSIINSQYYKKVELDGYKVNNTYFNLIINNNATPSDVKDYNYKIKRYSKPRYIGSRNTSDNFNTSSVSQSYALQTNQKISLDPSMREGVAFKYDTTIYEFLGGNTPREMPNFGRVNLNQIISTDNTSSTNNIKPNDDSFKFTIDSQLTNQCNLTFNQYISNIGIPTSTSFYSSVVNPEISAYMVNSDSPGTFATQKLAGSTAAYYGNGLVATVKLDVNGNYVTGSLVSPFSMSLDISASLASGNRWFISLFSGSFTTPVSDAGVPVLDEPFLNNNFDVLAKNSIYEIQSTLSYAVSYGVLYCKLPSGVNFVNNFIYGQGVGGGCLIWKLAKNSNTIMFSNTNFKGLGAGNFITKNIKPELKPNINYITETFGNKPKN